MPRYKIFKRNGADHHQFTEIGIPTEHDNEIDAVVAYAEANNYPNGSSLFAVDVEDFHEVVVNVDRSYSGQKKETR